MQAPESIKNIVSNLIDKHWEEIIQGQDFYEVIYDSSFNLCKIKIQMFRENSKSVADSYIIRITNKWMI